MRQRRGVARIRASARALSAAILAMANAGACDETFRPTDPGALHYSVFGFLDASADTQWIRVTPVRPVAVTSPEPLPVRVRLQHLGNGRVIELRDSVFRFSVDSELGSQGLFLHNFWTAERIEPGAAYRFTVRGEDGGSSGTVVKVPPAYEVEVWRGQAQSTPRGDLLHFVGLEHVALVGTTRYFTDDCGAGVERNAFTLTTAGSNLHRVPNPPPVQRRLGCGIPVPDSSGLWVAGSGAGWPIGTEYLSRRLNLPDSLSAIAGAVGFVGGVLVKTIPLPLEACQIETVGPSTDHCRLRYDGSSAVLTGTIRDPVCGVPVSQATVRLREIDPGPPAPYRIRSAGGDSLGRFRVGALQAGLRHELRVSRVPDGIDLFHDYYDTLRFAPGEVVTREIAMRRLGPCPA